MKFHSCSWEIQCWTRHCFIDSKAACIVLSEMWCSPNTCNELGNLSRIFHGVCFICICIFFHYHCITIACPAPALPWKPSIKQTPEIRLWLQPRSCLNSSWASSRSSVVSIGLSWSVSLVLFGLISFEFSFLLEQRLPESWESSSTIICPPLAVSGRESSILMASRSCKAICFGFTEPACAMRCSVPPVHRNYK